MSISQSLLPLIVVDSVPNWKYHLEKLKERLGRSPNARACGLGVQFEPENYEEYHTIYHFLKEISAIEEIIWYDLSGDQKVNICLRGLPANTDPEEVMNGLRELGYDPMYAQYMPSRSGRPGVFKVTLRKTENICQTILEVTELLHIPGIRIDPWRELNKRVRNDKYPASILTSNHSNYNNINEPTRTSCETLCSEPTTTGGNLNSSDITYPVAKHYMSRSMTEIVNFFRSVNLQEIDELQSSIHLTSTNKEMNLNTQAVAKTSSRKKCRCGELRPDATPTATIPSSTQSSTDIVSKYEHDPLEVKVSQFASEVMCNILDVIRASKVTNKAKILENAFLAASKIVAYRAYDNPNMMPMDYSGMKPEDMQNSSTHTQLKYKVPEDREPIVDAVCRHAKERIRDVMNIVDRDPSAKEIYDATTLACFRLVYYDANKTPEKCEQNAKKMYENYMSLREIIL